MSEPINYIFTWNGIEYRIPASEVDGFIAHINSAMEAMKLPYRIQKPAPNKKL